MPPFNKKKYNKIKRIYDKSILCDRNEYELKRVLIVITYLCKEKMLSSDKSEYNIAIINYFVEFMNKASADFYSDYSKKYNSIEEYVRIMNQRIQDKYKEIIYINGAVCKLNDIIPDIEKNLGFDKDQLYIPTIKLTLRRISANIRFKIGLINEFIRILEQY